MGLLPVTKYMFRPGFYQPTLLVLMNLDYWKKLPAPMKDFLTEEFKKGEQTVMGNYEKRIAGEVEEFKKAGVQIIQLPPEEAAKFSKMADDAMMEIVLKKVPEEGKKLKELVSKK